MGGAAPYWTDYSYDTAGNRTGTVAHTAAGTTTATYAYPGAGSAQPHAVTSVTSSGPAGTSTASFTYDPTGNTTGRALPGQAAQTLSWDSEGHLASVTANGSTAESDLYSADGNRMLRRAGGQVTAYLPGGQELTLTTATGAVTGLRYYAFAGQTIAVRNGTGFTGVTTLIPDNQGTAIASIADATDALTRRYADPFGAPRGTTPSWVGDHGFLNKATDTAIGLTQVGARYLDVSLGRFVSADPVMDLLDPQQWNAYGYANNNPVTMADPTGLWPNWLNRAVSAIGNAFKSVTSRSNQTAGTSSQYCGYSFGCANPVLPGTQGGTAKVTPYELKVSMDPQQVAINESIARDWTDRTMQARLPGWLYKTNKVLVTRGIEPAKPLILAVRGVGLASPSVSAPAAQGLRVAPQAAPRLAGAQLASANAADEFVNLASPARTTHILQGDVTGGGHQWPGAPGKSPFPESWTGGRIMHEISDIATDPVAWEDAVPQGRRTVLTGTRDGVDIRVVVDTESGEIITGYPTNTARNQ